MPSFFGFRSVSDARAPNPRRGVPDGPTPELIVEPIHSGQQPAPERILDGKDVPLPRALR